MRIIRGLGKWFWRFMIVFSFVVNIILVVVLLALGILIFDIRDNIATPLVAGLHSSFVGLDSATIDWTIPVRDRIPVRLNIPLQTNTTVTLTEPVPLNVTALIDLPGINAYGVNATVNLTLPEGLELPVSLDLNVPVDEELDIALDVRAVIPLEETQLHDVAENLRLLFEPLAYALTSPALPDNLGEVVPFVMDILDGSPPNLLDTTENAYAQQPWPGYSITAGLGYDLFNEPVPPEHQRVETGIVPIGGIPALDEQLRPDIYAQFGSPQAANDAARAQLEALGIPPGYYNGEVISVLSQITRPQTGATSQVAGQQPTTTQNGEGNDLGIIPPTEPTPTEP